MNQDDRIHSSSSHQNTIKKFHCNRCSHPLTDSANTDGRAEELAGVAIYLCESCAKKEQKRTDIEKIDCYQILRKLGRGWTTVVYKARHEPTGRLVALRRILQESMKDEWASNLFQHETLLMQSLVHPYIVRLIDYRLQGDDLYSAHEYMSGGDLHTHALSNPVPPLKLSQMICQILEGLHYLHQKGLIHRDVKPHNMLLKEKICKISDFGLAKKINGAEILKTNKPLGPLWYTAPEQIIDFKNVKSSADVYSVGVSFYHILTGKFPIHFPSMQETIKTILGKETSRNLFHALQNDKRKKQIFSEYWRIIKKLILKKERIPVKHYRKDLPFELAKIVDKAVRRNKKERFKTAQEMKNSLENYLMKI